MRLSELPAGEPKFKSNEVVGDISKMWSTMDPETKVAVTDPLMEELVTLREEIDTKVKLTPVHTLNDVSATIAKINHEVSSCMDDCLLPPFPKPISSLTPYMLVQGLKQSCSVFGQVPTTTLRQWSTQRAPRYQHSSI
jgi:hypothetical protein